MLRVVVVGVAAACVLAGCGRPSPESAPQSTTESGPTITGYPFTDYSHEDEPFAKELFAEHAALPLQQDPELLFVAGDLDKRFTHTTDLVRRSYDPGSGGPTIWFFGGSTTFGIGQRDEQTIPSEVARLAEASGIPVQVQNFGVSSYLTWQEVGLFRRLLREREAPDLVVFYHGVNDLAAICRQLALGEEPDGLGNPLSEEQPDDPKENCVESPRRTGELLARSMSRSMGDARRSAGFIPVAEFWQPFAATRESKRSDGPLLEKLGLEESGRTPQAKPYREALELLPDAIDLSDSLDAYDGPVYFDWAHTNEIGAELIARAMWDRSLKDLVGDLARRD